MSKQSFLSQLQVIFGIKKQNDFQNYVRLYNQSEGLILTLFCFPHCVK